MDERDAAQTSSSTTWVVVLGDYGRSPRMQFHTASLASKAGSRVHVVAYRGAAPLESLIHAANVHIHYLPEVRAWQRVHGRAHGMINMHPPPQALHRCMKMGT